MHSHDDFSYPRKPLCERPDEDEYIEPDEENRDDIPEE